MAGMNEAELARLMRAATAGDEKAYAEFLRGTAAIVRGFARRKIVQGGVDPEDVVQETLLAIHLKRHTWRQDAPILPWIYAIARFKLIDAFRRRGRRIEVSVDDFAETLAEPGLTGRRCKLRWGTAWGDGGGSDGTRTRGLRRDRPAL